ncbi:MAG: hydrolase Nlp/P60, partial [Chitinophagaceae bacterium]
WDEQHRYHGTYRDTRESYDLDLLWRTVHAWMNAPYLWGGRTFMGVDCSGFVQVVFKIMGVPLLRDAYQQATQGDAVESLTDAKAGDVAFFHNEAGKIIHVGILLNPDEIIHASGKVRIDKIDTTGIINSTNGKRTHQLTCIRRFLSF